MEADGTTAKTCYIAVLGFFVILHASRESTLARNLWIDVNEFVSYLFSIFIDGTPAFGDLSVYFILSDRPL